MRIRGLNRNLRRNGGAQMSLTQRAINILTEAGDELATESNLFITLE